ncbi:L-rhamnose-binding lectin CSL3 [Holothuria leucospilota]|uniref:L-rhamnose-binding lectin CSL3 n=1 Tax=Holothuria leucospilota TaxID=206669 RepID=A0A9Q1H384_HOLLE|nr:L-rhamnose-binding lectin CSL3 [Holothuria leucospilota]
MTVKDVTEAEISTSISGISTATTVVEVYLLLCEGETKTVVCPNNSIIEIVSASYGYNGNSTSAREECDPRAWWWQRGDDNTRCHEQRSGEILTNKCGGSSECEVFASNEVFGDPCRGLRKFLEVFYNCRAERPEIRETTMPDVVHVESPAAPGIIKTTTSLIDVSETQMRTTTSNVSSKMPWQDEHTEAHSEVVSSTPFITRNHSKTISKNTMTVKDVTEAEISTSISSISTATTDVEVYLLLCEGQTKTIVCPNNSIIEIVSASYGYNGSSTSAREECDPRAWPWERGDDNTRCHEQRSGEILANICGGSSECEVFASSEVFGDPCPGLRNFLEVFYYCRADPLSEVVSSTPAITRNHSKTISKNTVTVKDVTEAEISTSISGITTATTVVEVYLLLCEGQPKTVVCPNNSIIEIVSASYGYNGSSTSAREECDPRAWPWERGDDNTRCHEQRSGEILANICGGSSECEVFASSEVFGDPCRGLRKFLEVFYYCRADPLSEVVSSTPAITRNHSKTISKNTVTVKDVTEAEISTSISGISTATTVVEVYLLLCEGQPKTVVCPNNSIIEIVSASYGYNGSSTSAREECDPRVWWWERGDDNTRCHEQRSGEILANICGGSSECEVFASSEVFGDPCRGLRKFLEVFYYCRADPLSEVVSSTPAITRNQFKTISKSTMTVKDVTEAEISTSISGISTATTDVEVYLLLCESQTKTVVCPNNSIIEIVSASYGYNGSSTSAREECDPRAWWWEIGDDNTRCHEQRSGEILANICGGNSECEVFASSEVFGDPCRGLRKFLEVFYYCRQGWRQGILIGGQSMG